MKWLDWLLGEPPEPRGLYTVPGILPPVPSRGMYLDPQQVPVALMQPAMDAGQPAGRERAERGGYASGDRTASELDPPPASVTKPAPAVREPASFTLELLEAELPPRPGTMLRVLVQGIGREFFGPGPIRLGDGYSLNVNGELWRAILETVKAVDARDGGGTEIELRIEGRYPAEAKP